ncbi:hypothetical protein PC120_g17781 [Phytophthora cactorum]|nr:hypothetical protein PC120_g17781 [Phytophthora cactorum]
MAFLVKGHTKNHCDRHFGYIKRHYAKRDMWILDDVEREQFKKTLEKLYKKLDNIQCYQIFEVRDSEPGVVYCRTRPDSEPVVQNLLRSKTEKNFSADEVSTIWPYFTPLSPPPPNKENIHDIHKKVLQYVPPDLRSDPLYIGPDAADHAEVAATKRFRRQKAVQKKKRPAANADAPRKKRAAESDNQ